MEMVVEADREIALSGARRPRDDGRHQRLSPRDCDDWASYRLKDPGISGAAPQGRTTRNLVAVQPLSDELDRYVSDCMSYLDRVLRIA